MAILYGTTGDGTTLPVLVDQFGNLLAKGIEGSEGPEGPEGPKGDPGIEGPEGQKGDTGVGLPLPYGEDGSYLSLKDGEPYWTNTPDPDPEPVDDGVTWQNYNQCGTLRDEGEILIYPPEPFQYGTEQECWGKTGTFSTFGWSTPRDDSFEPLDTKSVKLGFENMFGKVIRLLYDVKFEQKQTGFTRTIIPEWSCSNSDIRLISTPQSFDPPASPGFIWVVQTSDWLFNREVSSAYFSVGADEAWIKEPHCMFRGWEVIDAGTYAVEKQLIVEQKLEAFKTAYKDRLSQAQD